MNIPSSELKQMKDHKSQHNRSRPVHRPRSIRGSNRFSPRIANGPRPLLQQRQLHGSQDMQGYRHNQHNTNRPKQLANAVQKMAVGIQLFPAFKNLQIPSQMPNDEPKQ